MERTYEAVQSKLAPELRDVGSMGEALEEAATLWGSDEFFTYGPTGETLTFEELDRRSSRLASALADVGVEKGDRVGLYLTNGTRYVVSIFACSKLGAIETR